MPSTSVSREWRLDEVVKRLRQRTVHGHPVAAQIFVTDDVPSNDVAATAARIVADASKSLKLPTEAVRVGKIRGLAKSFSIVSDEPDIFEAIAQQRGVKGMLESEQSDILPHPVKRRAVL